MTRSLLFEIGTEELPAIPLYKAAEQFGRLVEEGLDKARLRHDAYDVMSTPRRLAIRVAEVAESTEALEQRMRGPAVAIAFKDGEPTKAAQGFARGKGVAVEDLERGEEGGKEYVYAIVREPSRPAQQVLAEVLSAVPGAISWPKSQRWGARHETFARPVRWLLALYGDEVVPASFAGLVAGNVTRGNRLTDDRRIVVPDADGYQALIEEAHVVAHAERRAQMIREGIAAAEKRTGLSARVPEGTFKEVVNLVERPTVMVGHFEDRFLKVPAEIITEAMLKHQRYFPMYDGQGNLANSFIITSNGDPACEQTIVDGNSRVVRSRLADAEFFYQEDLKRPLESYVADLKRVTFQEKLGSVFDKTQRIRAVVHAMCDSEAGIDEGTARAAERAALLAKADLVTQAVIEFTSQQGVMGGYYALAEGDGPEVAQAISDHYRPRFAGDELPRNDAGKLVALGDKLDTICGIFAIGQAPTGSSDPYAVRRAAIGVINILLSGLPVSLAAAVDASIASYLGEVEFDEDELRRQVLDFLKTRLAVILKDSGLAPDVVEAVIATGSLEPVDVRRRAQALADARTHDPELFDDLSTAYARAANLADPALGPLSDEAGLGPDEQNLLDALKAAEGSLSSARRAHDVDAALAALAGLRAPIDAFFDAVLVMDEDQAVRERHLRLLNRFVAAFSGIAALDRLEGVRG